MPRQSSRNKLPKRESTPILIYITVLVGGTLGYMVGEGIWIRQVHWLHYLPIIPLGLVGYLLGKWIYKLRGYRDII